MLIFNILGLFHNFMGQSYYYLLNMSVFQALIFISRQLKDGS